MWQESSNNCLFEAHWDRSGKVRTLLPADKGEIQSHKEQEIFGMQEDRFGGLVAVIHAESSNAAYRIAQDHMLCMFMGKKECKHIKSTDFKSVNRGGAK